MRTQDTKTERKPPADRRYTNEKGTVTNMIDPEYAKCYEVTWIMRDGVRL